VAPASSCPRSSCKNNVTSREKEVRPFVIPTEGRNLLFAGSISAARASRSALEGKQQLVRAFDFLFGL
jgi:hypothetical protein